MKDNNKLLIGLGLGLIAAGSATYFLNTDEGKKFKKKTRKQLKALEKEMSAKVSENTEFLGQKLSENADALSQKLSEISAKALDMKNNLIQTTEAKIDNTSEIAEDKIEDVEGSFKSGAEYAKNRIADKADKIDDMINA